MAARQVALAVAAMGMVAGLTGCNSSSLSKLELVVYFSQNAPQSEHVAALKACGHVTPETVPEPLATGTLPSDSVGDVRFRIDHANDREVALLTECLNKQPGVVGVDTPDLTD